VNLYTTAQVASDLGVSASTIRTWKARKAGMFLEGQDFISQDGQTLWTEAGVVLLRQIQSQTATPSVAQPQRQESQKELQKVAETEAGLEALLQPLAEAIAAGGAPVLRRLVLEASARQALRVPATPAECLAVLRRCGIGGVDLSRLVGSPQLAGLLEGGESDE